MHCPPPQGLPGLDHRIETPRFDVLVQFLFETLEAFVMFAHGSDIFLQDELLNGRGADDFGSHLRWAGPQFARPV